jgi:hypothetical protein
VELGDFAGHAGGAVTEDFAGIGNAFSEAMRCFIKDQRPVFDAQAFEGAAAFAAAGGQKTDEEEFFVGQAGSRKGSEQRGWAGNWNDRNFMAKA